MREFTGTVRTWCVGSECNFEFEVEDDATNEEIEQAAYEAMCESGMIEWWYKENEKPEEQGPAADEMTQKDREAFWEGK